MSRYPHLIDGVTWTETEDGRYLLRHPDGERALSMGKLEYLILSVLDGDVPPSELARNLGFAMGKPISEASMRAILGKLERAGFVEIPPALPVEVLPGAKVHCHGSGECCHLGVGPLTRLEQQRIASLPWEDAGEPPPEGEPFVENDAGVFIAQREDGACIFLEPSGTCAIHRVFGYEVKPAICRLYPVFTVRVGGRLRAGVTYECPGVCLAGERDLLSTELSRAGELLAGTGLEAGPPTLNQGVPADDGLGERLERTMLAALADHGATVDEALGHCAELLIDTAGDRIPQGVDLGSWYGELGRLAREQAGIIEMERYRGKMAGLARLMERPLGEAMARVDPEQDRILRAAWRNYMFTRHHLFRFGLVPGLALIMLLQALVRTRLGELNQARGRVALATALPEALVLLRVLDAVSGFPGVGARVLTELAAVLVHDRVP